MGETLDAHHQAQTHDDPAELGCGGAQRQTALQLRQKQEIVGQAQDQRERIVSDTQTQIDAQAQAAVAGIRDDVVLLALSAAEKVTKKSLSGDDHRKMVEEALADADLSGLQKA